MKKGNPDAKGAGRSLMIVAGEVSGDMHAARVVRALQERMTIDCWGIGGDELRACGVETLYDIREMDVVGFYEVFKRIGFFRKVFNELLVEVERRQPDAVLLIDYPGFNLRLARRLHAMGVKVLYYVCPQVWAWNRGRIPKMAEIIDRLMVIFPFEVDVFKETDLRVDFVGHPLVDEAARVRAEDPADLPWGTGSRMAILPGSRAQEVGRILPVMCGAARRLQQQGMEASFIIAAPSERVAGIVRDLLAGQGGPPDRCQVVAGQTRQVLRQADAAFVASGTATLETALMGCPMLVVYRTALLSYLIGRSLIRVDHLGMVNIVAGRTLCPEFIQHDATPAKLATAMQNLLEDEKAYNAMKQGLDEVVQSLGQGGPEQRVAEIIEEELSAEIFIQSLDHSINPAGSHGPE